MNRQLHGMIPPLPTPYDEEGNINLIALVFLALRAVLMGASGIFIAGTTGRGMQLDEVQLGDMVRALSILDKHSIPLLVGCWGTDAREVRRKIHAVNNAGGATGVVIPGPYGLFSIPLENELLSFFDDVILDSPLSTITYNIPSQVGYELPGGLVKRFASIRYPGMLIAHKESGGDLEQFRKLVRERDQIFPDLSLFWGKEEGLLEAMQTGADGSISSFANFCPALIKTYLDAIACQDWELAAKYQAQFSQAYEVLVKGIGGQSFPYFLKFMASAVEVSTGIKINLTYPDTNIEPTAVELGRRLVELTHT